MATSTAPAIARFRTDGPPWVRLDGLPLLPTAAAFTSASALDVTPAVTLGGAYLADYIAIAIGSHDLHTSGTLRLTCNDWTSGTPVADAAGFVGGYTSPSGSLGCGSGGALCLED